MRAGYLSYRRFIACFLFITGALIAETVRPGYAAVSGASNSGGTPEAEYILPIKEPIVITSSFAEYRRGHFHGGLDFSTGGQAGVPVRAIASGYVARVKVSPIGYGKVLYIKLNDGRYAVYAHLQDFTRTIRALAEREQQAAGQYEVEFFPPADAYPVKQGEVVGYSGRSGSAVAHLHFELRDSFERPLNPLTHGLVAADPIPPRFVSVCVYPIGTEATVNGQHQPVRVRFRPVGGLYRAEKKVRVHGTFALSVYVRDEQAPNSYPLGPYRLETLLDGKRVFVTSMEQFSYSRTHDVDVAFDYRLARLSLGEYLRQFAFAGIGSEVSADQEDNAGVIDSSGWSRSQGTHAHTIRFVTSDAAGNQCEAVLEVFRDDEPILKNVKASLNGRILRLEADADDPDGKVARVRFRILKEKGEAVAKTMCPFSPAGTRATSVQLPASAMASDLVVEAVAEDVGGIVSRPAFAPAQVRAEIVSGPPELNLRGEWHENALFLTVKSNKILKSAPVVTVTLNGSDPMEISTVMETVHTASCSYAPEEGVNGTLTISARAYDLHDQLGEAAWSTEAYSVQRSSGGVAKYGDKVRVTFPEKGVYRPIFARIEETHATLPAEMPRITPLYTVEPMDEPVDKQPTIAFSLGQPTSLRGAGIYYHDPRGYWSYVPTAVNQTQRLVTAPIKKLGIYAVFRDTLPPRVYNVRPRSGSVLKTSRPSISAHVDDTGSGIDYRTIRVLLDGKLIICEYDPFAKSILGRADEPLAKGRHTLSISLSDYAGNESRATSSFVRQ